MKNFQLVFSILILLTHSSCGQSKEHTNEKFTNHLAGESSPYLLMHAHNPVDWYPWGEEALAKAKKEKKPIIISIGYAACHWCHVMERESYADTAVARFMNENFVSIKIDREERPDVDQVYMNAALLIHGSGGWPLNAIALPDGRPIYAGTYYPKENWLTLLKQLLAFIKETPEKAEEQATLLTKDIRNSELVKIVSEKKEFGINDLDLIFKNWKPSIDFKNGGSGGAPKFPMPVGYQFLLKYHYLTKNEEALKAVNITLDKMSKGGIYDQVGGGFARYSTDAVWKAPHFEKMLYDNAQLVSLYSSAFQLTKNPAYKKTVYNTLAFIKRELTSSDGGFYSSLDADSESEEGKFYVWTKEALQKVLGADAAIIMDYYNVTAKGNWEKGNNILYINDENEKIAKKHKLSDAQLSEKIEKANNKILIARSKRIRPATDDKILTAWNALMIKGYVDAYRVFDDPLFLDAAITNANFILNKTKATDHRLNRNFKNGKSSINGFLDDYAFTIEAFIALYQATFNEKWLTEAKELLLYTLQHFYDAQSGLFFYTSNLDPALIARKMELSDNVIPSSNSAMAKNLYILGQYFYDDEFIHKATVMVSTIKQSALTGKGYYGNWDIVMGWLANEPYEVAIVGENFAAIRKQFDKHYLPNVFFSGGTHEGSLALLENKLVEKQTTIYVCQNKTCKRPVTDVLLALDQIK